MTTEGKLGARIRKYREQLGLTREQLAVNAGLDAGFLEDIECDLVYPPIGTTIGATACPSRSSGSCPKKISTKS